jgi:beta-glucanase (GH16 family)
MYLHTLDGQPQSAAVVPLVSGQWGGQLYGRYTVRFRSEEIPGFKMAFLLWPDSDNWAEGEIDFPEIGSLEAGNTLYANVYPKGDLASGYPGENSTFTTDTQAVESGWHTAAIEWAPDRITFVLDGQVVGTVTDGVPDTSMHLVLQVETMIDASKPASDVSGHLQVDWVRIDSYVS